MSEPMVLHVTLSDGRHVNVNVLACVELAKVEAINADLYTALDGLLMTLDACRQAESVTDGTMKVMRATIKAALAKARGES